MTEVPETVEDNRCKHQALSLDLPILIFLSKCEDLLSDVHYALRVMLGNAVQDVEGVHADVGLRVREPNQRVVEEDIEPLLVEFLLLANQVSLAGIYDFVVIDVVLQVLDDLDSQVEIVLRVAVDELAYVLTLIRALLDNMAVVLEEVVNEELVEILVRTRMVLVDLASEGLAKN